MTSRLAATCAALAVLAVMSACGSAPSETGDQAAARLAAARSQALAGSFVEQAFDGPFTIAESKRTPVDANSDLVLTFAEKDGLSPEATAYLKELRETLDRVVAAGATYSQVQTELAVLRGAPDQRDPAVVSALATKSADVGKSAREILVAMKTLGFTEDQVFAALDEAVDGRTESGYRSLAALLADRQREILDLAKARAANASQLEVAVQAFLDSVGKDRRQLHVENYDTLPAGEYHPIPRFSTDMTPAERERFQLEVQESQAWATAIRSFQDRTMRPSLGALRDEFEAWVGELGEDFAKSLRAALEAAAMDADARQRLEALLAPVTTRIETIRDALSRCRKLLHGTGGALSMASVFDMVKALLDQVDLAVTAARELPGAVTALRNDPATPATLAGLLSATGEGVLAKLLDTAATRLPKIEQLVAAARKSFGALLRNKQLDNPADVPPELWFVLAEAPEARVELARSGVTIGDSVVVKSIYRNAGTEVVRRTDSYKTDIERMGWHRQISAKLAFARADTGPGNAENWQPSVAAVADLHYRFRDDTGAAATWNFFDPAIGVHLASLNQTDDSAEFGMGGTFSLFDGFITSGVGWNFSAEDSNGLYYFLGIDLFSVLESARGLGK